MNALQWQVGNVRVTRILEQETALPAEVLLPDSSSEELNAINWLKPNFVDENNFLTLSIHALVVETADKLIVVDTCAGNDKTRDTPAFNDLQTSFMADFEAAGFRVEDVDVVLCTHLHVDHVGWNTRLIDGHWVPTFPNARYLLGRCEVEYWRGLADSGDDGLAYGDSVQPLFDAGLVDLVEMDHRICPEVNLRSTPGHTPGHVSVHISSAGEEAIITGDMMHHPAQVAKPEWACFVDFDKNQSTHTRHRLLEEVCDQPVLVIGTHFASPTAGFVVQDNNARRFKTE